MQLTKRLWAKGDKFEYNNRTWVAKGVDIEEYYQTSTKKYYLKYDQRVNGRWLEYWVDADLVRRDEKGKK